MVGGRRDVRVVRDGVADERVVGGVTGVEDGRGVGKRV